MRVLILCPFVPWPPRSGGSARVAGLLREASRRHDLQLLALRHPSEDEGATRGLEAICEKVEIFPPEPPGRLRSLSLAKTVRRNRAPRLAVRTRELLPLFDLVHAAEPCLVPLLPGVRTAPTVVDHPKIEHLLIGELSALGALPRTRARFDAWKERRHLRRALAAADVHTACSPEDVARLRTLAPGAALFVVPNAFDPESLFPLPPPTDGAARLLFCGSLQYPPNGEAVEFLLRDVMPRVRRERSDVELVVVGPDAGRGLRQSARESGVRFAGLVEDVRPYLTAASAVVLPIRATGGGTRFKAIEAMAAARPVIATEAACEGLGAQPSRHYLRAEGAEETARAVLRVLADPALARRLAQEAAALVRGHLTWERAGAALEEAWRSARNLFRERLRR